MLKEGFQEVGISTKGYLGQGMLEEAFKDASAVSERLARPISIEVYPFKKDILLLHRLPTLKDYWPTAVTTEQILSLVDQYKDLRVSRLHLPFVYDLGDGIERYRGEINNPRHLGWMIAFGFSKNRIDELIDMAKQIEDKQQKGVALSGHINNWAGFAMDGRLHEIQQAGLALLTESAGKDRSTIIRHEDDLADPKYIADWNKRRGIEGLIIGIDHAVVEGLDLTEALEDPFVRGQTRAIHVDINHLDVLGVGNKKFVEVFACMKQTDFVHPVEATLEGDPRKFLKMTPKQRQEVTIVAFERLLSSQ